MNENLLLHILANEASDEEKEEFYGLLENNQKEEELFFELKSLWLRTSMDETTVSLDKDFDDLWQKIKEEKQVYRLTFAQEMLKYAAVLLFVLGIGGAAGYFISQQNFEFPETGFQKYTAMRGSVSVVEFPDGTKVWLNSESELLYREDHKGNQRLAQLSGEAYFEVIHRDDCPLIVEVGDILVRDLGTTFNIKAYPEDNYIETSLVEGKADILTQTGKTIVKLEPGESAMYHSTEKRMELRSITDNVLSAWREGKFVIRDQSLEDIFKELSRWYGIEFQFENNELRDYRFTGNIKKTTSALHVLKMLKATTDFNYRIIENVDKPDTVIVY